MLRRNFLTAVPVAGLVGVVGARIVEADEGDPSEQDIQWWEHLTNAWNTAEGHGVNDQPSTAGTLTMVGSWYGLCEDTGGLPPGALGAYSVVEERSRQSSGARTALLNRLRRADPADPLVAEVSKAYDKALIQSMCGDVVCPEDDCQEMQRLCSQAQQEVAQIDQVAWAVGATAAAWSTAASSVSSVVGPAAARVAIFAPPLRAAAAISGALLFAVGSVRMFASMRRDGYCSRQCA